MTQEHETREAYACSPYGQTLQAAAKAVHCHQQRVARLTRRHYRENPDLARRVLDVGWDGTVKRHETATIPVRLRAFEVWWQHAPLWHSNTEDWEERPVEAAVFDQLQRKRWQQEQLLPRYYKGSLV